MKSTTPHIDLTGLQSGGRRLEYNEPIAIAAFGSYRFPIPAQVDMEVERHGEIAGILGSAVVEYAGTCDRCLEEFSRTVVIDIDEQLAIRDGSDPLSDSNVIKDGKLDIADLVRQLVDAGLPYVARCRDVCRGLCLNCGMNLNEGNCSCDAASKGDHG